MQMNSTVEALEIEGAVYGEVAIGRRGHLFLVGGAQSVLAYALGEMNIKPGIKRLFKENLEGRRNFCESVGARYCHIVCPDKHSVLRSEFPFTVKVQVGELFKGLFGDLFIYSREELASCSAGDSYWRTDSHWNLQGKLVFARKALEEFGFREEAIQPVFKEIIKDSTHEQQFCGDLGRKLQSKPHETGPSLRRAAHILHYSNHAYGNNGTTMVSLNLRAPSGRLLMLCDSFAMGCIDIFSLFFREILLVRTPFFHYELARDFRPSHVLSSNVERYLPNTPTDREAPVGLLFPHVLGKALAPDVGYYPALNAQLRPGTLVYERFFQSIDPVNQEAPAAASYKPGDHQATQE